MEIIYSIILAAVQGLTEFIPVSSSGHLIILHDLLSFNLTSNLAFDAALHTGTFIAICVYFAQDVIYYIKYQRKFLSIILLASIPAGLAGLLLESYIDQYLRSTWVVIVMLVFVGIVFLIVEKLRSGVEEGFTNTISNADLIIGARSGPLQLLLYTVFHMG